MTVRRCAIYTRKSTDEGLDMAFNSLDAQREACEASIQSQKGEGWKRLSAHYDDGGFSGGSMERPGLQRLLADVRAGKVDIIVVYKVDRLTRSLADFAKIVDVLDAAGASFVSVTQAFNTTTSMGRLTLNVLLSFAQFEREVGAERIRDKIAASKARGIWMGGPVPLGYTARDRKLLIVPSEAATVKHIFRLYLELPSVRALKERLDAEGIVTKVQHGRQGIKGGVPFGRGGLYHLLANPISIGKLRHKDKVHEGEHDAIIADDLWEAVQAKLAASATERCHAPAQRGAALLTGMIRDASRRPMSPSFSVKQGRRYHYYVSSTAKDIHQEQQAQSLAPIARLAARPLEAAVRTLFHDELSLARLLTSCDAGVMRIRLATAAELARSMGPHSMLGARALLQRLQLTIIVHTDHVEASVSRRALLAVLDRTADPAPEDADDERISITIPADIYRRKRGRKLVIRPVPSTARTPDPKLAALIVKAHCARDNLFSGASPRGSRHAERLARLAFLAPDITAAILAGTQPACLTSRRLLKLPALPLDWNEQRQALGFG